MLARCYSGSINGVEASTIEIEVYAAKSTSSFAIVGLPDTAVKEAKDRVSTALKNSGYRSKEEFAVTVNLAPADVKKEGPIYDLPGRLDGESPPQGNVAGFWRKVRNWRVRRRSGGRSIRRASTRRRFHDA